MCYYSYGIAEKQDCDSLMQKQLYSMLEVLKVFSSGGNSKNPSILIIYCILLFRSSVSPVQKAQESTISFGCL